MRKTISIYEIIAGLAGIVLTIFSLDLTNSTKLSFGIFSFILFVIVSVAGYLLLRNSKLGFILSIIVQCLQVINFNLNGIKFEFCSGSKFAINFFNLEIDFAILLEDIKIGLNTTGDSFLSVNLIPILIILLLIIDNRQQENLK